MIGTDAGDVVAGALEGRRHDEGWGGGGHKPDTNSTGRNIQRERSVPSTISRIAQFVTGEIQIIRIKSWTQSM